MNKKQAVKGKGKNPVATRDWGNMEPNMLLMIFASLSAMDILMSISRVCRSWKSLCDDTSLWKTTIDLSDFKNYCVFHGFNRVNEPGLIYFKIALNFGGEILQKVSFDSSSHVTNDLLFYAARRCQKLKGLEIRSSQHLTAYGIARAFALWGSLESLFFQLGRDLSPLTIFPIIASNCKNLTELKLRLYHVDNEICAAICEFFPGLKVLCITCPDMGNEAIEVLLDGLVNLEELYVCITFIGLQIPFSGPRRLYTPPFQVESLAPKLGRLRFVQYCLGHDHVGCCDNRVVIPGRDDLECL